MVFTFQTIISVDMIFYAKREVLIMEMEKAVFYETLFAKLLISVNKKESIIAFCIVLLTLSSDPGRQAALIFHYDTMRFFLTIT